MAEGARMRHLGFSDKSRKKRGLTEAQTTKQARYRRKMRLIGCCPHCGKSCAPYSECQTRRDDRQIHRAMKILCDEGIIERVSRGLYQKLDKAISTTANK